MGYVKIGKRKLLILLKNAKHFTPARCIFLWMITCFVNTLWQHLFVCQGAIRSCVGWPPWLWRQYFKNLRARWIPSYIYIFSNFALRLILASRLFFNNKKYEVTDFSFRFWERKAKIKGIFDCFSRFNGNQSWLHRDNERILFSKKVFQTMAY